MIDDIQMDIQDDRIIFRPSSWEQHNELIRYVLTFDNTVIIRSELHSVEVQIGNE